MKLVVIRYFCFHFSFSGFLNGFILHLALNVWKLECSEPSTFFIHDFNAICAHFTKFVLVRANLVARCHS